MRTSVVSISLPSEQIPAVDEVAAQQRRSRSSLIAVAVDEYLERTRIEAAGRARLKELEALAAAGIAKANEPSPGTAAGEQHLAEHARLTGLERD